MFGPRMSEKDGFQALSIARKTPLHLDCYPETRLSPRMPQDHTPALAIIPRTFPVTSSMTPTRPAFSANSENVCDERLCLADRDRVERGETAIEARAQVQHEFGHLRP